MYTHTCHYSSIMQAFTVIGTVAALQDAPTCVHRQECKARLSRTIYKAASMDTPNVMYGGEQEQSSS